MKKFKIQKSITNRESESLDKYFREVSKIQPVSAEEEIELTKRVKQNDKAALDRLVSANLRFVISVAKQYQNQGLALSDLINDGNLGLIKAAQKFDESRGFKFISYAVWWIRQSILASLAENSRLVAIPTNKINSVGKVSKAAAQLEQTLEREPTSEEIAEVLSLSEDDVDETYIISTRPVSIDEPFLDVEEGSLADVLEDTNIGRADDQLENKESLSKELQAVFACLDQRESAVLMLHFGVGGGYPMSMEDIAEKFDLTKERIRQIKDSALKKIRNSDKIGELRSFL